MEGYVRHVAKRLRFGQSGDKGQRITLYTKKQGKVEQLYRYSSNVAFMCSTDRYDKLVEREWNQGHRRYMDSFPQNRDGPQYLQRQKTLLDLTEDEAKNLTMKSRVYYICRCENPKPNAPPLGVILVESEEKPDVDPNRKESDRFSEDNLRKIFEGDEAQFLSDLLVHVVPAASQR
jgi:hypothetical protein